jgi:predicted nuclease of predicted toxin-antitoxin system
VWLRCGNITNRALREWLEPRWAEIERLLREGERFIEVK